MRVCSVDMPPLPSSASSTRPLGKRELLAWAAETSGVHPCDKYADLRDGAVLLALAHHVFLPGGETRALRRGPNDAAMNWDALRKIMEWRRLPLHLCDRRALAAGHARYCFNMLVLFYFLAKLSHDSDFSVDFSNPIDPGIAEFLQSSQSLLCVGKVPAVAGETEKVQDTHAATVAVGVAVAGGGRRSSTCSADPPPPPPPAVSTVSSSVITGNANECMEKTTGNEGKGVLDNEPKLHSFRVRNAQLQAELDHVRATSQLMLAQQRGLVVSEVARMREQFEVQMALVRLERDHEMEQFFLEMHEEYACFLDEAGGVGFSSSLPSSSSGGGGGGRDKSAEVLALEGKVRVMERELGEARRTVQELRSALLEQRDRHDAFAKKIHAICSAATLPGGSEESVFLDTVTSSLETQPQAVRDAVSLRLKTLLSQVTELGHEVEQLRGREEKENDDGGGSGDARGNGRRLQLQMERLKETNKFLRHRSQYCSPPLLPQRQHKDWYAVPLADGLEAPSCIIDSDTCDAICAQVTAAVEVHSSADSPVHREVRRLVAVVQILQSRVQTASAALIAYRDRQQELYEQMLSARQDAELNVQEMQRAMDVKLDEQRLRAEAKEAALSTKMRLVEERCSRRESIARMLHERVRDMISSLQRQTANAADLTPSAGVQEALQQVMTNVSSLQRTRDSLEAALGELSEEVATLRQELARREREAERLEAALVAAQVSQRAAGTELAKAKAEVAMLRDAIAVEVDTLRCFVGRIGESLLMEGPPPSLMASAGLPSTAIHPDASTTNATAAFTSASVTTTTPTFHHIVSNRISSHGDVDGEKKVEGADGVASAATSLLSPEELERRKMAILSKYGFSNKLEH